jgi:hypothetical protein
MRESAMRIESPPYRRSAPPFVEAHLQACRKVVRLDVIRMRVRDLEPRLQLVGIARRQRGQPHAAGGAVVLHGVCAGPGRAFRVHERAGVIRRRATRRLSRRATTAPPRCTRTRRGTRFTVELPCLASSAMIAMAVTETTAWKPQTRDRQCTTARLKRRPGSLFHRAAHAAGSARPIPPRAARAGTAR